MLSLPVGYTSHLCAGIHVLLLTVSTYMYIQTYIIHVYKCYSKLVELVRKLSLLWVAV